MRPSDIKRSIKRAAERDAKEEAVWQKVADEKVSWIDDMDISTVQNNQHQENIDASEKLLHRLEFYHGATYANIRY
jgi:hypothetical protein